MMSMLTNNTFTSDVGSSMLYATDCNFTVDDVEEWMWTRAAERAGYWTITIPFRTGRRAWHGCVPRGLEEVIYRRVNFSQREYSLIDKVVTNQVYAESKAKVHRAVVYQRSLQLWETGNDDDVTMRTLGAWAISCYKCQTNKFNLKPMSPAPIAVATATVACGYAAWKARKDLPVAAVVSAATALGGLATLRNMAWVDTHDYRVRLSKTSKIDTTNASVDAPSPGSKDDSSGSDDDSSPGDAGDGAPDKKSKKNKLGYQKEGEEYINEHEGGGTDEADSEIRANVIGRLVAKECGIGVVGQTTKDEGKKRVCGVLSQPISCEPNVYAQEVLNAIKAIEERIDKKQRPYAGNEEDEKKIKRMVYASIHGRRNSPFSAKKVFDLIHTLIYDEMKSKKWTDERLAECIEALCREIDPQFKLKCAVKLEPMPEEKAPRLLIADEDRGQVMALMTIYCIETLIKKHFPAKGIKGLSKRDAIKRVMKACRVPRKVAKKMVTIFEGDGSAWDTCCSAEIRALVENPVIEHVAGMVNGFIHATPQSWAEAHVAVCADKKLDITYSKNNEFHKETINAIRRSGHRGTSCLNWWVNFVCWHCAIFEDPELFLDPAHRYGRDVTGMNRWLNSAFEGDDSFLVTAPRIEAGKELHVNILQFWERIGFNMKIEIRNKRALFVGYYIGLDERGPLFDEKKDEWMMVPEVDRCFSRAGTSCSPSMIEAFDANDRTKCMRLAGSAAMSRAYEFAGLAPTISNKFLNYAINCDFELTHDLNMRTNQQFDDKSELVDCIRAMNATCDIEKRILISTGFAASDEECNKFEDFMWDYDQLGDWEGFKNSLPQSWRA